MHHGIHGPAVMVVTIAAICSALSPGARASTSAFEECEAGPEGRVEELSLCVYEVARRRRASWAEADRRLQRLGDDHPEDPWPWFYLGHVHWFMNRPDPGEVYRRSIDIGDRYGPNAARVEARAAMIRYLCVNQELDEAERLLDEARRIAAEDGGRELSLRAAVTEASVDFYRGSDLDRAFHRLKEIEPEIFPAAPDALRRDWLMTMKLISYSLERNRELVTTLQRQLHMARETGDVPSQPPALYGLGVLHVTTRLPTPAARDEALRLFEASLAAAQEAGNRRIEGLTRLELGKLLAGEEGREHLRICRSLGDAESYSDCLWALASNLLAQNPDSAEALELVREAVAATDEDSEAWSIYGWEARLLVHWATLSRPQAIRRSLDVIASIETLREAQSPGRGRTGLLSRWIGPYYWLSGRLLGGSGDAAQRRQDLELAFTVTERMRARVLLEALEAARASSPLPTAEPLKAELDAILARKVKIQRRWIDPRLTAGERAELREQLDAVEREEEAVRSEIERAYPAFAVSHPRDFASLDEIERSLGPDEALLSFQLGLDEDFYGRFAGGSWLLSVTRDGTRSYRLPGLAELDGRLSVVVGFDRPEEGVKGYVRLYRDLFAEAAADLPATIDKLTILADGKLHRLPFAFLRSGIDAEPLISRYQLSVAPSAKLWLRWRRSEPSVSPAPALVFADPANPVVTGDDGQEQTAAARESDLAEDLILDPLPHARREGRAIVRALGGDSRLLQGSAATEHFVKSENLRRFGILHFATHAFIDEGKPERSRLKLAPGRDGEDCEGEDEGEDGWLQPWEIVELGLDGRVVVLASCRTAVGEVVRGEGPMSLARAFFTAEAPVVVAGLWQLPDAGTSNLVERFYRHLARGTSVAEALATAQRKLIGRGASGGDWAGLVVLGNGALVPFPGGLPRPLPDRLIVAVLAVLAVAAFALVRRRRSFQG